MIIKKLFILIILFFGCAGMPQAKDCKDDPQYQELRKTMVDAFNLGDSTAFFAAVTRLEDYLYKQDDLHLYYTQRCNEIVFLMNTQKIYEAYKKAQALSKELRERGLDKEMYMAINMMGHINRYFGNYQAARNAFEEVIRLMEENGYYESMPPIYMNIVEVENENTPEKSLELLNKALEIARKYDPNRVFDIEGRRLLHYYYTGDMKRFAEGYKAYRAGADSGLTSVSGRAIEVYYQAYLGNLDKAARLAKETLGEESDDVILVLYRNAGLWKEAFDVQTRLINKHDSIDSIILANNMKGIEDEIRLYELERKASKTRTIYLAATIFILLLLICALLYIIFLRRRHMKELKTAYKHALESDKMKSAFIRNVTHEVRTPLNIISGFAQLIAEKDIKECADELKGLSQMVIKNTNIITTQLDELIEISINENSEEKIQKEPVNLTELFTHIISLHIGKVSSDVEFRQENNLPVDFHPSTNKNMLTRMVNLLLDNAIKNTTKGYISLQASKTDSQLMVSIEDTGCGIDISNAERIFERFVKLDDFKKGLGLGLTLCRTIATRLGGYVLLDTTYNGPGARFVITLPL